MKNAKGNVPKPSLSPAVQEIFKQTVGSHFVYCNLNPQQNDTSDCVIRAICAGTGKEWEDVLTDIFQYAIKYKYAFNDIKLYDIYLADQGWIKHKAPHKKGGKAYLLKEWLKKNSKAAILSVDNNNHLTYAINHQVYDTWDCSNKTIDEYWTIG